MEYYIVFQGPIEAKPSLDLVNALLEANNNDDVDHITLLLSSKGGSIYYGLNIATVIKNLKKPIRIHASNEINSIANIIYLSAKERSSESYAKFFLHGASIEGENLNFNLEDLKEQVSSIEVENIRLAKFIFEATGIPMEKIQEMMRIRKSLTAEQAFSAKIVLEVKEEIIPVNALRKNIIYV